MGLSEIIVIVLFIVALFSPEQLRSFARKFGKLIRELKEAKSEFDRDIVDPLVKPVGEIKSEIDSVCKEE